MKSLAEIRQTFIDFFVKHGHEHVSSSSLVPHDDPTLLFTNAGMVQFKNTFTGKENRETPRAVTSQKCVRAGGKHNDLENVGYTARHHTFFEMLGNFSFGDYFKEDAIAWSWELITKDYDVSPDKLLVTVYHEDDAAFDIWKKVTGFSDDKIIRIATSDNFWSMGDVGPCGPCSEIFYDHGDHIPGGPPGSPDEDGDRFVEIWNLVFMQYEQISKEERVNLPKPSIDTGMGLERIAALLQGKHDNYDTDLFLHLRQVIADLTKSSIDGLHQASHKVISDHLRCASFLMADGVLPSNEGRGYVLRRIMRRAMRHVHILGYQDLLLWQMVDPLIQLMGEAYPELERAKPLMLETFKTEEEKFKDMLGRGLSLLEEEMGKISSGHILDGQVAFKLYDTYGFPVDLTQDILRSHNLTLDIQGFDAAMEEQRQKARQAWSGSGEQAKDTLWFELEEKFGSTTFLGYEQETCEAKIIALIQEGELVDEVTHGEFSFMTDQTVFYGESGGQVGDSGHAHNDQAKMDVLDTQKPIGQLFQHRAKLQQGSVRVGEQLVLEIDHERRQNIRLHHSATHLLHESLRRVLGDHVAQKGSLVCDKYLRFDFSHSQSVSEDDLRQIENQVNKAIRSNDGVINETLTQKEAIAKGALALFGEKYGDVVRVISMGPKHESDKRTFSIELCGGTHVKQTGDIGFLKIISESAVSSGVRRIEACCGEWAEKFIQTQDGLLKSMAVQAKTSIDQLPDRLSSLMQDKKQLEKQLSDAKKSSQMGSSSSVVSKKIGSIELIIQSLSDISPRDLKGIADQLKKQTSSGVIVVSSDFEGKASLVISMTSDLIDQVSFDAVSLVRAASPIIGGKGGGGRPDMAQAGGSDPSKFPAAFEEIEKAIAQ